VAATGNPDLVTELALAVGLDPACTPALSCTAAAGTTLDERHEPTLEPTSTEVLLQGLLASTTYSCALRYDEAPDAELAFSVTTDALPARLSGLTFTVSTWDSAATDPAFVLLNVFPFDETQDGQYLVIVDREGAVRWYLDLDGVDGQIGFEWVADHARFAVAGGLHDRMDPQVLTLSADAETTLSADAHHDVKWVDDALYVLAGSESEWCIDEHVIATGKTRTSLCHDDGSGLTTSGLNSLVVRDESAGRKLYVTSQGPAEVVRLDATTGTVDWRFGATGDFTGPTDSEFPDQLHDLRLVDCAGYDACLLYYDNGVEDRQSSGVKVGLHEGSGTATILRTWTETGWYSAALGGIEELNSGDWLIGQASMYTGSENGAGVVQVAGDGTVTWRMALGPVPWTLYRVRYLDGCAVFDHRGYCSE